MRHTQEKLEKVKKTNGLTSWKKKKPFLTSDFLKGLVTQNSKRLS